ncbi:Nuclear pore protein 84/107 [Trinorchestia longiramus]|nr:Nuclear pore protein 84/107 [Trinorchestia longiramus]
MSRLNDSLARLDAILATPSPKSFRIPRHQKRLQDAVTEKATLETSLVDTESPLGFSQLGDCVLGNMSAFAEDVTVPLLPTDEPDQTLDLTVTAVPVHNNAQVLFSEFVRILVGEHTGERQGDESGVWGEVMEYEKQCHQQAQNIERIFRKIPTQHPAFTRTKQVLQQLLGERNMWRLVRSLYVDRQCRSDTPDHPDCDMAITWLKSDQTVITELYDDSREIREAQLVVDWLEKNAADALLQLPEKVEHYTDSHVAWENTLRQLKACARTLGQGRSATHLVTSLDPDAPVRQKKAIHDLDQDDDRVLVRNVMLAIRSGQLYQAQDKCVASGKQWLAATIEGWKLHHDPNVYDPCSRQPVTGNPYRDVWKTLAWRASEDCRLSQYQRALYASMCGNLRVMKLVCQDWEDLLWAHFKAMVDQRVEERLRLSHAQSRRRTLVPLPKNYPEQRMSVESVFSSVEKSCTTNELKNPYYLMCKYLILDDMDGLLTAAKLWLSDGPAPHLLRCLTHLLLVLRRIYRIVTPEQEDTASAVLHACVKASIERGDVEQVAWYTAMLPETQQVSCYAGFLLNISDPPQRRHALHLAHTVGLDIHAIATTTTAIIRLSPSASLSDGDGLVGETGQGDRIKIAGLDWLLFDDALRKEALVQALALVRTFLIARKISAANTTMDKLPSDTLALVGSGGDEEEQNHQPPEVEAAVREYLCIKTFLSAQECFSDWFDHFHQQKPSPPASLPPSPTFQEQIAHDHAVLQHQTALDKWQATLDRLTKLACERLYNVLLFPDGGWLVDPTPLPHQELPQSSDNSSSRLQHLPPDIAAREPDRNHQLSTLRSIYIPQVCSLLQNVLSSTGDHKQCIQLADIVASEQHQLYTAFGSSEIQRFLLKLLESSRYLLDHEKDALGYLLH